VRNGSMTGEDDASLADTSTGCALARTSSRLCAWTMSKLLKLKEWLTLEQRSHLAGYAESRQ